MNIWALDKDFRIKHLLILLQHNFGDNSFEVISEIQEKQAVRLIKINDNSLSVYIYTYGQNDDHYGVHLEYPNFSETNYSDTLDIYDNVNYETLCGLVQMHLDLGEV